MAYDINATLERLEQGLNEIDSARMQVQNTVLASNELQATVAGYVSSINKFVGEIKEWEKHLEGTHVESTKDVQNALTDLKASCEKITELFSSSVDGSIKNFNEQNILLEERVKDLNTLRDEIKSTTIEIQSIKDSLSKISKEINDSQKNQDDTIEDIKQRVIELPETIKDYTDSIIELTNNSKKDLKEVLDESNSTLLAIDRKMDDLKQTALDLQKSSNGIQRSCDNLKSTVDEIKSDIITSQNAIEKSISINRWVLIIGVAILIAIHFI